MKTSGKHSRWWRSRAPGGNPWGFFLNPLLSLSIVFLFSTDLVATTPIQTKTIAKPPSPSSDKGRRSYFVVRAPYIPQKIDLGFELGTLWDRESNYWVGLHLGPHLGRCMFSFSQTCQQYLDFIVGFAGRESHTHFHLYPSLRWQFVSFPNYWSLSARLFAGFIHSIQPTFVGSRGVFGAGIAWTTYLHPRADLKIEFRYGNGPFPFYLAMISTELKVEKWVEFFADKLEFLGIEAQEVEEQR